MAPETTEQAEDIVVGSVRKNATTDVRVTTSTYRGRRRIDVRQWLRSAVPSGEATPTKAGVNLRPRQWAQVVKLVIEALHEEGIEIELEGNS